MLERLTLWNIGGIRRAELTFGRGLTVITGESGAGKSSVVRAIELVGGKRGEVQLLRAGEDEGGAEARFRTDVRFPELSDALQPEEGTFLARRTLLRGGRARSSLQGLQIPLATYSVAAARLLRIQSQFAQMELLDDARQLAMLDSCTSREARDTALELCHVFDEARARSQELRAMSRRREEIERRYANAQEVLDLVRKVAPEPGLETGLEASLTSLARRIARRERAQDALNRLFGGLSEPGLLDEVKNAVETFEELLPAEARQRVQQRLREGLHAIEEAVEEAREELRGQEEDMGERDRLEARLGALRRLKRLSGSADEEGLLTYCREASLNLEWLEKSYPKLEELTGESLKLRKRANALAMALRHSRQEAAAALSQRVNALLKDLAMEGTSFELHLRELGKLRRDGADEAEFALRDGTRVGRVDKIASGGELSRLLLALQLSLPQEWTPPTLVFDEVEAGLGGRAAVLSGMKLKELSRNAQVILVTHEASIAALGDAHVLIQRAGGESQIEPIEGEARVREIARMLSGSPDLTEAQEHARKLLTEGPW